MTMVQVGSLYRVMYGSINESINNPILFSDKDSYVHFDKFGSGKNRTLLITGLSGSGKSTLARELCKKYNAYYVEVDVVSFKLFRPNNLSWDYIKENDKYLYRFFKEVGLEPDHMFKNYKVHGNAKNEIVSKYIEWLCFERKDKRLVVCEGGDVAVALRDIPRLREMPIIFKGTSIALSMMRRFKRDSKNKGYAFGLKNMLQRYVPQYSKMIPEVNSARRLILK